jgi:hypothetical protein
MLAGIALAVFVINYIGLGIVNMTDVPSLQVCVCFV